MIDIDKLIFCVDGERPSAQITKKTGSITPATDSNIITISTGISNFRKIIIYADVDEPAELAANTILKANADVDAITDYTSESISETDMTMCNNICGAVIYRTSSSINIQCCSVSVQSSVATLTCISSSRIFKTGQKYKWIAWGWDE